MAGTIYGFDFLEHGGDDTTKQILGISTDVQTGAAAAQGFWADFNIGAAYGVSTGDPVYGGGLMGNIIGTAGASKTQTMLFGVCGKFDLTGTISTTYPTAAVRAEVGDGASPYAAVLAVLGGDTTSATPTAAFGVDYNTSIPASKFTYGVDLQGSGAHDGYLAPSYTADLRLASGGLIVSLTTAITANVTTTTLAAGTLGKTTHATGRASLFVSDATKWQFLTNA